MHALRKEVERQHLSGSILRSHDSYYRDTNRNGKASVYRSRDDAQMSSHRSSQTRHQVMNDDDRDARDAR